MTNRLEQLCAERGVFLNSKRRAILDVLEKSPDHPTAVDIYRRTINIEPGISLATVYRTLNQLSDEGVLLRHTFSDGKTRYEEDRGDHHEHLIDVRSGNVVEFEAPEVNDLIRAIAARLGYSLLDYRLEVFAEPSARAEIPAQTTRRMAERDFLPVSIRTVSR